MAYFEINLRLSLHFPIREGRGIRLLSIMSTAEQYQASVAEQYQASVADGG
jgi:hypothetical protein